MVDEKTETSISSTECYYRDFVSHPPDSSIMSVVRHAPVAPLAVRPTACANRNQNQMTTTQTSDGVNDPFMLRFPRRTGDEPILMEVDFHPIGTPNETMSLSSEESSDLNQLFNREEVVRSASSDFPFVLVAPQEKDSIPRSSFRLQPKSRLMPRRSLNSGQEEGNILKTEYLSFPQQNPLKREDGGNDFLDQCCSQHFNEQGVQSIQNQVFNIKQNANTNQLGPLESSGKMGQTEAEFNGNVCRKASSPFSKYTGTPETQDDSFTYSPISKTTEAAWSIPVISNFEPPIANRLSKAPPSSESCHTPIFCMRSPDLQLSPPQPCQRSQSAATVVNNDVLLPTLP
mmetsp:Transcript_29799/g.45681  ORF Transcript_29799/g.45681 Transcript_29799/m.45681 type:complete len:344 (+) Transcript_29799:424-1455(+)|eukprot:CAMPEP_0195293232 /NCGR_PEP_ID=MMETSP0707-20130614/12014_1 /TAXON_ID=33640 /ORGANISM="Asterionellopsis glacialis, Strain CCMP134" /LENGTH=343 /DNA_ID=CAMNT_0040353901 /DNA_START=422 /DNA_END=1453 /DNA_ORIENTATION=-